MDEASHFFYRRWESSCCSSEEAATKEDQAWVYDVCFRFFSITTFLDMTLHSQWTPSRDGLGMGVFIIIHEKTKKKDKKRGDGNGERGCMTIGVVGFWRLMGVVDVKVDVMNEPPQSQ